MLGKSYMGIFLFGCILQVITGCIAYPDASGEIRIELPGRSEEDFIIEYMGYAVSYDEETRLPVWVAYELTSEEAGGTIGRSGKSFRQDQKVKAIQADNYDYRGSGWSRGHMAPAGDFKWDEIAMWDTFFYTNCCPQDEKLNNGSWNVLENKVRSWAKQFGRVYVVTGPIIGQNRGGKIGNHEIVVPDAFFKTVLIHSNGEYHGVAFVMFNNSFPQSLLDSYMSIDELESLTGLDFFPELDDSVEMVVESKVDLNLWKMR